ncbi:hypothetical protein [Thorsellia anophelis]|uniref:Uncharacterized protein n=1 Tax=Thorsellia anophelis DSM 18579 TaxID=1123402 RepID=A0A1I0FCN1_9GAMM|nr:hypothetical protein [Thorsellia anophelis]SET56020.1 hypothetical protein SAMN02583745_02726 [Thorsellia anophelis DSM 18579]
MNLNFINNKIFNQRPIQFSRLLFNFIIMKIKYSSKKVHFFISLPVLICFSLSANAVKYIEGFWEAYTFDGVTYPASSDFLDVNNSPDILCKSLGNGYSVPTIHQMTNGKGGIFGERKIGTLYNEWGDLNLNPGFIPYIDKDDENKFWVVGFSTQETTTDPIKNTSTSLKERSIVNQYGTTRLLQVEGIFTDFNTNTKMFFGNNKVLPICVRPII